MNGVPHLQLILLVKIDVGVDSNIRFKRRSCVILILYVGSYGNDGVAYILVVHAGTSSDVDGRSKLTER
jgi:hypothetical protein